MKITVEINKESWTYTVDSTDVGNTDFFDAIIAFESLLKSIYPDFENHNLAAICPDGNIHDPDESCKFIEKLEVDPPPPPEDAGGITNNGLGIDLN